MVHSLQEALSGVSDRYEIIVVDDGSRDGTGALADELAKKHPEVKVVHHPKNLGYGAAVRSGIEASQYEFVFFTDGDCQFDVREIEKLIPFIGRHDIVTGYRAKRQDNVLRSFYALGWNWLIRLLLGVHVQDLNCAFKLFKKDIFKGMELRASGAMINAEILALATKDGRSIYEVPVSHHPRIHGQQTGGNPKVIVKAFWELLKFWRQIS